MTKVFVFGTFDGLHPGHLAFLAQARALGDELVVSVAQDRTVEQLKRHAPLHELDTRIAHLKAVKEVTKAVAGDARLGLYECYRREQPDLVAFGYDQTELEADFKRFQQTTGDDTPTIVLKPYQPETFKSSLLNV